MDSPLTPALEKSWPGAGRWQPWNSVKRETLLSVPGREEQSGCPAPEGGPGAPLPPLKAPPPARWQLGRFQLEEGPRAPRAPPQAPKPLPAELKASGSQPCQWPLGNRDPGKYPPSLRNQPAPPRSPICSRPYRTAARPRARGGPAASFPSPQVGVSGWEPAVPHSWDQE